MQNETIVAVATPAGQGGVGILRLSGPKAYFIAKQLNENIELEPRKATYCNFRSPKGELIDKGLLLYFKSPFSFTGEDVVEFQAHGSPFVLDNLLKETLSLGARVARPGEFSLRAFLNDKIDLAQAEAIADLISASSNLASKMALRSLEGDFSKKVNELNEKVIYLRLYVEAAIDFPEEEIDFLADGKVETLLLEIESSLNQIIATAAQGSIMREGLSIVIVGKPNAGKSTLINCLAGKDIAIVTEIAGTTRDVMREHILLDEIPIHLVDTAGLRESNDPVEQEGIKRAWQEVAKADCVLMINDATDKEIDFKLNQDIINVLPNAVPILKIYNKVDSLQEEARIEEDKIFISAKHGLGINYLKEAIKKAVGFKPIEGQFLARRRHLDALEQAKHFIENGKIQLLGQRAGELLAADLNEAHKVLGEITGSFTPDDLLGRIFSSFCIGK
ncbi:MAG: tRNA uridine-5-carboxymethylaminomethyl(34) synthesis GTPase MnmE [Proteobacteria bacterium]|nr:tRNA uridine-5-carboxymethylaminomethyl(34) synthesis GTPase MnmE [Pseudomonadota bacterium]